MEQPKDCERVLKQQPPYRLREGDNLRTAYNRQTNNLTVANETIREGRGCVENQRKAYGKAR